MHKRNREHTWIIALAYLARYGYWALMLPVMPALSKLHVPKIVVISVFSAVGAIGLIVHFTGFA